MATTEFYRCNGAAERADALVCLSKTNYLLIFGFGTDEDGNNYTWRKYYDHKPTVREIKQDISDLINADTSRKILTGMKWNGIPLWLSQENQRNISDAVRAATLPVRIKLGEDEDGNPIYYTFEDSNELTELYKAVWEHIRSSLDDGWREKDSIDYDGLIEMATQEI